MSKKVLVTGGAGFIGSNIARRLIKDGQAVRILDNLSNGHEDDAPKEAELILGDINDQEILKKALADVEVVYHLAASASVVVGVEKPVFDLENNVRGTVSLLSVMRDQGVKKILFPSSSTVYGINDLPMKEGSALNPVSPYAVGKIADEYYLRSYFNMYGIEPIIFRIFNAFGPYQDLNNGLQGITGYIIGCVLQDKEFNLYSNGEQTRDFIYIDEIVEAFVRAEKEPKAVGQIMNLACGDRISLNDWIAQIERVAGKKLIIKKEICDRAGDVAHYQADISALKDVLDFNPKADFENQIKLTVDWAKNYLS